MSPPTKAPPAPDHAGSADGTRAIGPATHGTPAPASPQAAALGGQQTAGNQAMASLLGAPRGVQRAPNDEDPPNGPVPSPADIRAQRVAEGIADMGARSDRRIQAQNVRPINDPDEAARIFLEQRGAAGGNIAMGRNDMYRDKWRYDHYQYTPAPGAGWINADGTVVIDRSNPLVRDAVERLARERGSGGGGGGGGGGGNGGRPAGPGGAPDRGDPRQSGMAHGPTLNSSGGVATAPTLPGQAPRPNRPMGSTAVAHGRDEDDDGGPAPAPRPNRPMGSTAVAHGRDEDDDGGPAPGRQQPQGGAKAPAPGGAPGPGGPPGPGGGKFQPPRLKVATGVDVADAQAEFRRNPARVYRSENSGVHQGWWDIEPLSKGKAPQVIRSGNTYIIGPDVDGPDLPPKKANPAQHDDYAGEREVADLGKHLDKRIADAKAGGGQAPVNPPTPGQRRIDPDARRRDPEPGMKQAVPVSHDEVVEALRRNPDKVYQSKRYSTHAEWYTADRGRGAWPRAYRSGSTIIVDPDYPLDGRPPASKPPTPSPTTGERPLPPAPAPGPDPTTKAAQTISPTGHLPQEKKPAKWDVKKGELSRETAQEEKRVTDEGTSTRVKSRKTGYSVAKGASQEWKDRQETQTGDKLTAKEQAKKVSVDLGGIKFNRQTVTETGATPDGPKAKTEKNVGGGIGPDGLTGNADASHTTAGGTKAEARADIKLGPDGIALTGTGQITTPKGFTGHLSVSGKHNVVASDPKPRPDGKFAVEYVVTDENGVELGGGMNKPGGGASIGVTYGQSTTTKDFQTKVFNTKAEARNFQLFAAMQLAADTRSFDEATSADDVLKMKEGEVRGTSKTETDSVGGSAGVSVVSVGVTSTDATTTGLKIERMAGNKVRVTPSIAEQEALNASISVAGKFGNTKGESTTKSFSVTYEFDLGTEGGKQAYEKYKTQRLPPPMPPHAKWINTTTGLAMEDHDVYKFAHIGEIGWGSHAQQETVVDEAGTHTTAVGGQTEKVQLNAIRKLTFDKNRHAEANIVGRMTNGQITSIAGQLTVGGEDGSFNRDQFRKIFRDKGAPAGTEVTSSGEWTLSAQIDKKLFERLERDNDKMKQAKTREERLKIYSEMAREGGAEMLGGQVRQSGGKLAWNLELKGDPNFPGATGRALLNQQRAKLQAQLKDRPDNAGAIAAEAKDAIAALSKRLKEVGDKKKYTDLPDELRQEQVDLINTHLAEFRSVRSQALSVQMRGGRKEDLTDVLRRAADEHGYDDVAMKDRAWRKAQDLVTIHETELHTLENEIVGVRAVVMKLFLGTGDVRWGKGVHQQVFKTYNANAKEKLATFRSMAPRLTEAVSKMRAQKEKWSAEPDPKERENLLREYDAYVMAAIQIADVQLTALRDVVKEAYVIAPDAAVSSAAALKVIETAGADKTARANAIAGLDIDGSAIP